ncbi:putative ESAT-6-like protein 12 [Mycobacterium tuberculosis]|nr:putative ESAT-6-like protein 12 [Mycobacterium tuberculosis]
MAEPFRVDPTVLADAVARMAEFGRHVEELVAEIESLVTRLHVTWTGEGAAAHAEAQRHWAAGEAMMRQAWVRRRRRSVAAVAPRRAGGGWPRISG